MWQARVHQRRNDPPALLHTAAAAGSADRKGLWRCSRKPAPSREGALRLRDAMKAISSRIPTACVEDRDHPLRLLLVLGVGREGSDGALPPCGAFVALQFADLRIERLRS